MANQPLDRGYIRHGLDGFVARWRPRIDGWTDGHEEKSHAQSFWVDLLNQFGIQGERVDLFEREAVRATTGNRGYIDVFWSAMFIGEAKSPGGDLPKAEKQAVDYLTGGSIANHEMPRFILSTDFNRFRLTRLGPTCWTQTFTLKELPDRVDLLMFLTGHEEVTPEEQEDASIEASKVMAGLYTAMVGDDADEKVGDDAPTNADDETEQVQYASMFLTRLLFLLYGDDAGLWEADLFHRFVLLDTTPDNLGGQLTALFQVLNKPSRKNVPAAMAAFPHVNGALYADPMPVKFFTPAMRDALLNACRFRWTRISPAVFGSMFQMVKSKESRRSGGEHYTTETNILKTVGPLFLDELQTEADRLCRNAATSKVALAAFHHSLATHTFLDPACGSGNFLTIAYGRLRDIETQIIVELRKRSGTTGKMALDATMETKVTIDQFHGIEINWWPAKIAETAMFLVDHQANRKLALAVGDAPDRLPIEITAHIHHKNALTVDWSELVPETTGRTFVFGNPPFLGHDTRTPEQAAELRSVWGTKDIGRLDYVTGWHAQAIRFMTDRRGDMAFVTTNSITQGDQVPRLFRPLFVDGWRIKFAHRTFPWTSEAPKKAAVHCVIVGFTRDQTVRQRLWDYPTLRSEPVLTPIATGVNAYLADGSNVLVDPRPGPLSPLLRIATFGNMPRDNGGLVVEPEDYPTVASDPFAAKYLRPTADRRNFSTAKIGGACGWSTWTRRT